MRKRTSRLRNRPATPRAKRRHSDTVALRQTRVREVSKLLLLELVFLVEAFSPDCLLRLPNFAGHRLEIFEVTPCELLESDSRYEPGSVVPIRRSKATISVGAFKT